MTYVKFTQMRNLFITTLHLQLDIKFRQQAYDAMVEAGKDVSAYNRDNLMSAEYDETELQL